MATDKDIVELWMSREEALLPGIIGVLKTNQSFQITVRKNPIEQRNQYSQAINGDIAEMAFAKFSNRYWDGHIGDFEAPDVDGVEVKANMAIYRPYEKNLLMVQEQNLTHKPYVHMAVQPVYKADRVDIHDGKDIRILIFGWQFGSRKEWRWNDPFNKGFPCFNIHQKDIEPISLWTRDSWDKYIDWLANDATEKQRTETMEQRYGLKNSPAWEKKYGKDSAEG